MPQYLVSGYLPDNYDLSVETEATIGATHALNREMIAAGVSNGDYLFRDYKEHRSILLLIFGPQRGGSYRQHGWQSPIRSVNGNRSERGAWLGRH